MSKKHVVITKLFDSGGSNSHFKTLIKYLGEKNVLVILEDQQEEAYLNQLVGTNVDRKIITDLHPYAHLSYRFSTNVKELFQIVATLWRCFWLSARLGFADVTISAVEPERFLYFFWLPFLKVRYILHTQPVLAYTSFTVKTCNKRLSQRKQLITVSFAMKETIIKNWGIKSDKAKWLNVVYNCLLLDSAEIKPTISAVRKIKTVLTIGHVDERKNPYLWLQTANQVTALHPEVEFVWFGNGPLLSYFQSVTASNNNVFFKGHTDEPYKHLSKADIYYQPSLSEPHGIAVVEAMYHSLPCVVSNTGGLPESVLDNYNGIVVEPTNVETHVGAIIKLVTDHERRNLYAKQAFIRFVSFFTYPIFKMKMDGIYINQQS